MNNTQKNAITTLTASISWVKKYIYLYYTPVLFLGIFGNIFALVLLLKRGRQLSQHLIPMVFTAVSDSGTLLTSLVIDRFVAEGVGAPSTTFHSLGACKTIAYFWGVTNALSVNTISIIGMDRFIALRFPIWHRTITRKKMLTFCAVFTVVIALCSIPLPVYWVTIPEYQGCYISSSTSSSGTIALQVYINLCYNGILSLCALFAFDIAIVKSLLTKRLGHEITRTEQKVAANLLIMAIAFLLSTLPRCIAFSFSFFYGYIFVNFQKSFLFLEVAKILDVLFYTYCAFSWCIYVVRFKLIKNTNRVEESQD